MWGLISSIQPYLTKKVTARVDNVVFRLHYHVTVLLISLCILLGFILPMCQNPISCLGYDQKLRKSAIEMYCWMMSTYTVVKYDTYTDLGDIIAHPGVGNHNQGDDIRKHAYYQWVPFFLSLQAVLFYAPRYLWRYWDEDKFKGISCGLDSIAYVIDEPSKVSEKTDKFDELVKYFIRTLSMHNKWAYKFFFCEVLNFINVVGNIYFTDLFLGYQFTEYGMNVVNHLNNDFQDRIDPMDSLFPKVSKCTFHSVGPSGTIQKHDALCVLPRNIIYEKIYVFLWFWFVFLSALSAVQLIYRLMTIFSTLFRSGILRRQAMFMDSGKIHEIGRRCQVGDWLVLHQLGRNMKGYVFSQFLSKLEPAMRDIKPLTGSYDNYNLFDTTGPKTEDAGRGTEEAVPSAPGDESGTVRRR